ncbi:MAG: radical SAM protein [Conexivisphaera sp.]
MREANVVRKKGRPGAIKVGLLYPSTYEASLASLAYQSMYYYVNSRDDFVAERFVYGRGDPPVGLDTGARLHSMDILIASVHYELDYSNLLEMLRASGLDARRSARSSGPPLIVGGPAPTANPAPISEVADLVAVGDLEPLLPPLLDAASSDPHSVADALAGHDGFFSSGVERVRIARATELSLEFHPIAQIQPLDAEPVWGRSLLVESTRGCSRLCRFCMEGNIYFPRIDRPLDQIRTIIELGLRANGVDKVTFYSLSFFDHPAADRVLEIVAEVGATASLPSIRLDTLNDDRVRAMAALGQRTVTLAPESGSCPLRRALGKPWSRDDLARVARVAASSGMSGLKLYYMIGLPGEGEGAADSIVSEVAEIRRTAPLRISVSITPFMPKPHTPMQWAGMEDEASLDSKVRAISSRLRASGVEVDSYSPRLALVQTAIARGNSGILCPIELRSRGLSWGRAFGECGLDLREAASPLDPRSEVPWSVVDTGRPARALEESMGLYWLELARGCGP